MKDNKQKGSFLMIVREDIEGVSCFQSRNTSSNVQVLIHKKVASSASQINYNGKSMLFERGGFVVMTM